MNITGILFWDRISSYNLLSEDEEFEYAGTNPCAEEPLPAGGSCLLGALNLSSYVENGRFNYDLFRKDVHSAVRGLNEVLDEGLPLHPLQIQRETVRDYRQIGLGIMGLADMLIKMGLKYDTEEALYVCEMVGQTLADEAIKASALLAKEQGVYPKYKKNAIMDSQFFFNNAIGETIELVDKYGLRNSQILTIAPTGSISTMIEVSGGIEPIFSFGYNRMTKSLHGEDKVYKVYTKIVKDYMEQNGLTEEEELPNFFVNAQTINPFKRVEMQGVWQRCIDASISSTVNLPNEATIEQVEQLYISAWEHGLKGMTIYRDGCARSGILTLDNKKEEEEVEEKGLARGEWEQKPKGIIELNRKIKTGCSTLNLHIGILPKESRIVDFYVTHSSQGGCRHNINAVVISMSAVLRLGGSIENIRKAFKGLGACPSFVSAKAKGLPLSKGVSCPTAILNVLEQVERDLKNKQVPELIELGFYNVDKVENKNLQVEQKEKPKFTKEELKFLEEHGASSFAQRYNKCPECGEKIEHIGGCIQCLNCSYTKCE